MRDGRGLVENVHIILAEPFDLHWSPYRTSDRYRNLALENRHRPYQISLEIIWPGFPYQGSWIDRRIYLGIWTRGVGGFLLWSTASRNVCPCRSMPRDMLIFWHSQKGVSRIWDPLWKAF